MSEPFRDSRNDAIPLGYESVPLAHQNMRGQKLMRFVWIFFATVGVLFLGVALLLPALGKPRPEAQIIKCAANLKNIGLAIQIYANDHNGNFPATFEELLLTSDLTPSIFVCPASNDDPVPGNSAAEWSAHLAGGHHLSNVYVGKGLTLSVPNAVNVVVAYEPPTNHNGVGSNFFFADGHVEWMSYKEAKALIAAIPPTRRPSAP